MSEKPEMTLSELEAMIKEWHGVSPLSRNLLPINPYFVSWVIADRERLKEIIAGLREWAKEEGIIALENLKEAHALAGIDTAGSGAYMGEAETLHRVLEKIDELVGKCRE